MSLAAFLESLLEGGRARPPAPGAEDFAGADAVLKSMYDRAALQCPGPAPALDLDAARWGAVQFLRGCQFLVYRELGAELLAAAFSARGPDEREPRAVFSADLTLQRLPELAAMVDAVSLDDPLKEPLLRLGRSWPLSSVGMKGLDGLEVAHLHKHASLWRLYVDRIMERADRSRLADPRVREAVAAAIGMHGELCPGLRDAL